MDRRAQALVARVSVAVAALATLSLLYLLRHESASCFPAPRSLALTLSLAPSPRNSCDAASRRVVPPERRLAKLRLSPRWRRRTAALAASAFPQLRGLGFLAAPSRVLPVPPHRRGRRRVGPRDRDPGQAGAQAARGGVDGAADVRERERRGEERGRRGPCRCRGGGGGGGGAH